MSYKNPIKSGFNPDPSICYVEGKGYFLCTSTFIFTPALPIYHSTDMINWKLIGHAINRRSQGLDMRTVETDAGIWAPTIRYNKARGKWYVACTSFYKLQTEPVAMVPSMGFYVETDDIFDDSKWSDLIYLEEQGFDQDILFDDDGRTYLTTTRFELANNKDMTGGFKIVSYSCEFDLKTGYSLSTPVLTLNSELGTAEGCHIIKHEGMYYLFSAEGGTQDFHRECVYRSKNPLGPWEAPPAGVNPVIFNDKHPDIQNTGHMDLIEGANGQWWAVFLGVRPVFDKSEENGVPLMTSHLGRETFMAPAAWVDGWPVVNNRRPIELTGSAPGLTYVDDITWIDEFKCETLSLGWYSIRTPVRPCYSLTERPGSIGLRGSPYTLESDESPACLLQKQPEFDVDWSTEISFEPKVGEEAGTTLYLHKYRYVALGIRSVEEGKVEMVYRAPGTEPKSFDETSFPLTTKPGEPIALYIKARRLSYEFSFATAGSKPTVVGSVSSALFKPLFTGVQIGIYAQAARSPCLKYAFFSYARFDNPKAL